MKVETPVIPIDRSTIKNELSFDINEDDKGMVFRVLRKQMYPNPKKTFIQEILSNARDAHREAGKPDLPVDVQLPTQINPEIIFRDYGPGISPERMENVFIKYGSSTKRESNDQTGGFGLGAKTPLAYTDTFEITTFIPDSDGNMRRRVYTAYIDETNVGKLAMHDDDPDGVIVQGEKQGTMIKVLCKPGDVKDFGRWVNHTCILWNNKYVKDSVRPNVIAADFEWDEYNIILEGDKWFCLNEDSYRYEKHDPVAVIDGVQYKLSWDHLDLSQFDDDVRKVFESLFRKHLFIFFNTGQLPVAATREEIEYTDSAKKLIHKRFGEIAEKIRELIREQIADAKNLWDANVRWRSLRNGFSAIVNSTTWKDSSGKEHKVTGEAPMLYNCGVSFLHYSRAWRNNSTFRKNSTNHYTFAIADDSVVVYNDECSKRPSRRRLRTIFENDKVTRVTVIQWPEDDEAKKMAKEKLDKKDIDLYAIGNITDYDKAEVQKNNSGYSSPVTRIWEFKPGHYNNMNSWSKNLSDQKDLIQNGEGVYVVMYNRQAYYSAKKHMIKKTDYSYIHYHTLNEIVGLLGIDLYGIGLNHMKKMSKKWIPLEQVMLTKINELLADPNLSKKFAIHNDPNGDTYGAARKFSIIWDSIKDIYEQKLTDKDSLIYEYFTLSKEYSSDSTGIKTLIKLSKIYDRLFGTELTPKETGKKVDLKKMYNELYHTYPLLATFSDYGKIPKEFMDDLMDYLNAKDLQRKLAAQNVQWVNSKKNEQDEEAAA